MADKKFSQFNTQETQVARIRLSVKWWHKCTDEINTINRNDLDESNNSTRRNRSEKAGIAVGSLLDEVS